MSSWEQEGFTSYEWLAFAVERFDDSQIDRGTVESEDTREVDVQVFSKNVRKANWAACDHDDEREGSLPQ